VRPGDAALKKWKVCVVGSAMRGRVPVWISTQMAELEVAAPFVTGKIGALLSTRRIAPR
jgi:hypothetical protein